MPSTQKKTRWIIASNRLPFSYDKASSKLQPSSGGLVTAISGINTDNPITWVGVAPDDVRPEDWEEIQAGKKDTKQYLPVFVQNEVYARYYNGMCNTVLWPLLHYESNAVNYNTGDWQAYIEVNRLFAKAISDVAEDGDLIWIHDFHLFLLPRLLKRRRKKIKVGFFLHTPFPSSEIFRELPVRKEILESVLSADLVGFHDYSYLRHFTSSIYYVLGMDSSLMEVRSSAHTTKLGVFPVSIDTPHFQHVARGAEVKAHVKKLKKDLPYDHLILGVDRLDYIKGLPLKLRAFRELLKLYGESLGRVGLMQIAVPSRVEVPGYRELKEEVEQLIGEINGQFGSLNFVPVQYMYASIPFEQLLALYQVAHVLLVTSQRDGMNLVALEYLAAQNPTDPGVVVLSEFAGAISTLSHAFPINPWDTEGTAHAIYSALTLAKQEKMSRFRAMTTYLEGYTATNWAASFMDSLSRNISDELLERTIPIQNSKRPPQAISELFNTSGSFSKVIVFMDYDGTTVPIENRPELAVITPAQQKFLSKLCETPHIELVIVSGRPRKFLLEQFDDIPVNLAAEHGSCFYDRARSKWKHLVNTDKKEWSEVAFHIMEDYSARVPGSFTETKQYSLTWHHRLSPPEFGDYQALKLKQDLEVALVNKGVTTIMGKKAVEVRSVEANKGLFAQWYLKTFISEQVLTVAIGDDETDEDLFTALAERGISIKVGPGNTKAKFRIHNQQDVQPFLEWLMDAVSK